MKNDIYKLRKVFNVCAQFVCYNGTSVTGIEGLCIYLKQYSYPCWFSSVIPRFERLVQELCVIPKWVLNHVFDCHSWRLTTLNQPWLFPNFLGRYCQTIHNSGELLQNSWVFVDGSLVNICRSGEFQRLLFNGHKRDHTVRFHSVVTPNGSIANLFNPSKAESTMMQCLESPTYLVN